METFKIELPCLKNKDASIGYVDWSKTGIFMQMSACRVHGFSLKRILDHRHKVIRGDLARQLITFAQVKLEKARITNHHLRKSAHSDLQFDKLP